MGLPLCVASASLDCCSQMLADMNGDFDLAEKAADLYEQIFTTLKPEPVWYEPIDAAFDIIVPPPEPAAEEAVVSATGKPKKAPKKKKQVTITPPTWPRTPVKHNWMSFNKGVFAKLRPSNQAAFKEALTRWRSSPLQWVRVALSFRKRGCVVTAVSGIYLKRCGSISSLSV